MLYFFYVKSINIGQLMLTPPQEKHYAKRIYSFYVPHDQCN